MLAKLVRLIENTYWFHAVNAAVAAVWIHDFTTALATWRETGHVPTLMMCAMNALLVIFYVTRRRSTDVDASLKAILMANLATFGPFLYQAGDPLHPALAQPCLVVMSVTLAISLGGCASLGRSWGIIPANRGIRTGGLYRVVRHPIYASYMIFDVAFTLSTATWRNAALAVTITLILYARARYEEAVLRRDPAYLAYSGRTRFMLFPGLV